MGGTELGQYSDLRVNQLRTSAISLGVKRNTHDNGSLAALLEPGSTAAFTRRPGRSVGISGSDGCLPILSTGLNTGSTRSYEQVVT
jgi:hypothetical protein